MKKLTLVFIFLLGINAIYAQANRQLNFGLIGISYDIPIGENLSIAPMARTNFDVNYLVAGVKLDYYFDTLIDLPAPWDLYGGANTGFVLWKHSEYSKSSSFDFGLEVGARYFWSEKWGVVLEFSGGINYGGMLGLTMKL